MTLLVERDGLRIREVGRKQEELKTQREEQRERWREGEREGGREGKRMTAKNRGVLNVYFVGGSAECVCVYVCVCVCVRVCDGQRVTSCLQVPLLHFCVFFAAQYMIHLHACTNTATILFHIVTRSV